MKKLTTAAIVSAIAILTLTGCSPAANEASSEPTVIAVVEGSIGNIDSIDSKEGTVIVEVEGSIGSLAPAKEGTVIVEVSGSIGTLAEEVGE